MNAWPKPGRANLDAFYGKHQLDDEGKPTAAWESRNLVKFIPPFQLVTAWDPTQRVSAVKCHRLVADSLKRIFVRIWKHYGSQAAIEAVGLHLWGGAYEHRRVSGSDSLSTHAWGAGVDWNPAANPRGKTWYPGGGMMPEPVIVFFREEGWSWGGFFANPDAMHFEAVLRPNQNWALPGGTPTAPHAGASVVAPAEPFATMGDAMKVPPFPEPQNVVNHEGAHVYTTLAGQMAQAGYRFGRPLPAFPPALLVRNAWRAPYGACMEDAIRQWVRETAANFPDAPTDPALLRAWWRKKGFGDPTREAAERLDWFVFEVMGGL